MSQITSDYRRFQAHIWKNQEQGQDCEGRGQTYIPKSVVKEYWTTSSILKLLETLRDGYHISVDQIQGNYLIPFSIIVAISSTRVSYLEEIQTFVDFKIDDHRFPLIDKPDELSDELWNKLSETQWRFCPLDLDSRDCFNKNVDPRYIFPGVEFQDDEALGQKQGTQMGADKATLKLMTLGRSAIKALKSSSTDTVVIKSYPHTAEPSYRSELKAYNSLQTTSRPCEHIVKCYGSYYYTSPRDKTIVYNLILEYADRGSLLDFYERVPVPRTPALVAAFLLSLSRFLTAVEKIHNDKASAPGGVTIHHDIKPSNILIFSKGDNIYDFTPKLSDFGMSTTKAASQSSTTSLGTYNDATSTFSPPEVHLSPQVVYYTRPARDMWAVGCIIVDAVVWAAGGNPYRRAFASERQAEIRKVAPGLGEMGYGDCFHDKTGPLACVRNVMQRLGSEADILSSAVVKLTVENVLTEYQRRIGAGELLAKLEKAISKAKRSATSPRVWSSSRAAMVRPSLPYYSASTPVFTGQPSGSFDSLSTFSSSENWNHSSSKTVPTIRSGNSQLSSGATGTGLGVSGGRDTGPPFNMMERLALGNEGLNGQVCHPAYTESFPSTSQRDVQQPNGGVIPEYSSNTEQSPTQILSDQTSDASASTHKQDDLPNVSIQMLEDWRDRKKKYGDDTLIGKDIAFPLIQKRDHIFVIDNSRTMQKHKDEVINYFSTLAYLLKEADEDGVEVLMTSDKQRYKDKKSRNLRDYATRKFHAGRGGHCFMEDCLINLFKQIISNLPDHRNPEWYSSLPIPWREKKPISIYILTDGDWTLYFKDAFKNLTRPIQGLVDEIQRRLLPRTQVVLQFVRFGGNSNEIIQSLDRLDDFLSPEEDIVDHKSCTHGIWHVLVGSLDFGNDRLPGNATFNEARLTPGVAKS